MDQKLDIKGEIIMSEEMWALPWTMVLLGEIRVSHRQTFLWRSAETVIYYQRRHNTVGLIGVLLTTDADLLSLDCPAVAMRLEDVIKAKSPQVLVWHCQLCQREQNNKHVLAFVWRCSYTCRGR